MQVPLLHAVRRRSSRGISRAARTVGIVPLLAVAGLGGLAGATYSSSTATVTTTTTFVPAADARVEQAHPTRNY
jgi:hypothetical protein